MLLLLLAHKFFFKSHVRVNTVKSTPFPIEEFWTQACPFADHLVRSVTPLVGVTCFSSKEVEKTTHNWSEIISNVIRGREKEYFAKNFRTSSIFLYEKKEGT